MPAMSSAHEAMVQSRIKLIEAELELKLANLEWMYVANLLAGTLPGPSCHGD